jgi:glutamine amidotransferase PdxT
MIPFHALICVLLVLLPHVVFAQFDDFMKEIDKLSLPGAKTLGDDKIISGLKEALSVGTENTVKLTGNTDGFLKNEAIKILLPEKLQSMDKALRLAGFGPQVDEFVVSMNRAAEQAAPLAKPIFTDAVTNMSFDDAKKILNGGDTAATDYFQGKTRDQLATAFKPEVEKTMSQVGVTTQYKELVGQYTALPFVKGPAFNLDDYVVGKSLDGLFYTLAQEEQKIRTNPAARATDLLKEVFGK